MSPSISSSFSVPCICLFIFIFSIAAEAVVPPSKTFKKINQGDFEYGFYAPNEYNANYRYTDISSGMFILCFYNTTPNAFTLGLRMGYQPSDNPANFRWVWAANRGTPVGENAALTFHADGNLILADTNGKIAWQTGTSNKGVVGLKLLENGNLVLHDKQGKFVWQSFDHPTDTLLAGQGLRTGGTLLAGQGLRTGGPAKLVSRVSNVDGSEGPYSFVLEKTRIALYLRSKNSPNPLLYYTNGENPSATIPTVRMVFNVSPENSAYQLRYEFHGKDTSSRMPDYSWTTLLARPKYNSTYSFLRLESNGDVKIYTFGENVDYSPWEVTYSLFGDEGFGVANECKLPKKCGPLGLCDKNQCVACPRPKGLKGWSESCAPPRLPLCKNGAKNVDYYKVVGVEHFMGLYNEGQGPINLAKCQEKCTLDCKCLGVFYREESSKCFLAPELGTLSKVSNKSHVAYIKIPKYAKLAL